MADCPPLANAREFKVFRDSVHGLIEINEPCLAIINTPHFQRLRYIKQMGLCYHVFPGATHSRYEHSLGVSHLAYVTTKILQTRQPELEITEKDILCVEIAGLTHDLGHGPFSHMFDSKFIPKVRGDRSWKIVSNKQTGVDVDKWDYFARDCLHLGNNHSFDNSSFLKYARVIDVDGLKRICTRKKEIFNLYNMYFTRYDLHRTACYHEVNSACELMAMDILHKANDFLMFRGKEGSMVKLSDCIDDMTAYTQVTDYVMWQIYMSESSDLQPARDLLKRLHSRDLYKMLAEQSVSGHLQKRVNKNDILELEELKRRMIAIPAVDGKPGLEESHFLLHVVNFDFGRNDQNPLDNMRYFTRESPNTPIKVTEAGLHNPPEFRKTFVRVYSRVSKSNPLVKELNQAIEDGFSQIMAEVIEEYEME